MANFRGHITTSILCGVAYGGTAFWLGHLDWGVAGLAAALCAVGGMLPDLDSDSGKPVRELFGLAAALVPLLLVRRLMDYGLTSEQVLVVLAGVYLFVRYGVANYFRQVTVHRGMFHSIPAMFIAGLLVYLLHHNPDLFLRLVLAVGVMLGFLSHLILDEVCAVDLRGLRPKLNQMAGSALKFASPSWSATAFTYLILFGLAGVAFRYF